MALSEVPAHQYGTFETGSDGGNMSVEMQGGEVADASQSQRRLSDHSRSTVASSSFRASLPNDGGGMAGVGIGTVVEEDESAERRDSVPLAPEPFRATLARALFLLGFNAIFTGCFFLLFAAPGLGYGDVVFRALIDHETLVEEIFGGAVALLVVMYVTDAATWTGHWIFVRAVLLAFTSMAICAAILMAGRTYPGAPLALYLLLVPIWMTVLKRLLFRKLKSAPFLLSLSYALLAVFAVSLVVWLTWVFPDEEWTEATRMRYAALMQCKFPPGPPPTNTKFLDECLVAYILWLAPLIAAVAALVFGFLAYVVSRTVVRRDQPLNAAVRAFLWFVVTGALGVWVAASVAGSGSRISNAVNLFIAAAVLLVVAVMVSTVGFQNLRKAMIAIPLIKKASAYALSNWMKALFLMVAFPFLPIYVALSFLNQRMRSLSCLPCTKPPGDSTGWLTARTTNQLAVMRKWRWSSILVKIMWIALFYIIVSVGVGKMVTLFLSWLNEQLSSLNIGVVSVIFIAVGISIFLLPPVPGVPVYLAAGVIIVEATRDDWGFWGGVAYATFISFMLKMMAIAVQQKLIGERLSNSVWVKKTVGINSVTIQAIRLILEKPGLSPPKVFILIGGPDWPTSVLTGILKLSLFEMLLGSLPVIFLVVPVVLAGAFLLRQQDGGIWGSLFGPTITLAALTQLFSFMSALFAIEKVATDNQAELEALPKDPDVEALNKAASDKSRLHKTAVDWHASNMPFLVKALVVSGAVAGSFACYINVAVPDKCFKAFQVSDSIDEKLDGSAINIFETFGWVVLGLTVYTIVVINIFGRYAKGRVSKISEQDRAKILGSPDADLAATVDDGNDASDAAELFGNDEEASIHGFQPTRSSVITNPEYQVADPGSHSASPVKDNA